VARFVEKIKLRGNGFTSGLEIGDYFIWKFYPQLKVFVDGRLEAYPETFFEELFQTLNNPSRWPLWEKKYGLTFILLDHTNPKHQPLLSWLYRAPSWKPIYLDGKNVLFLKEMEEYQEILRAYTMDLLKDPVPLLPGGPDAELGVADFYAKLGILDKAEPLYRKNLPRLPHRAELHNNFGNLLRERGNPREALLEYQKAVALEPKNYFFHYNLGRLYTATGEKKLALGELEKVVKLSPSFGGGHLILGMLYAETRRDEKAEKEFKRIRPSDVASLSAHNALGVLYAQQGKFEEAEREFKEVLERDPHAAAIKENLKKLQRLRQK